MAYKKSLSEFTDRQLLEVILMNQVQFERRLENMELHLYNQSLKEAKENGVQSTYYTDAHNVDGRKDDYTFAQNFIELIEKSRMAKDGIDKFLSDEDSEIYWED